MPLSTALRRLRRGHLRRRGARICVAVAVASAACVSYAATRPVPIRLDALDRAIKADAIASIDLRSDGDAIVTTREGRRARVTLGAMTIPTIESAIRHGTSVGYADDWIDPGLVSEIERDAVPPAILLAVYLIVTRVKLGRGSVETWMRSDEIETRFSDVAGAEDAKEVLSDVVAYFRDPRSYERLGARQRRGVLLSGGPGNGKTLLAKATAGEAGVSFLAVKGSDVGGLVIGLGALRLRRLFARARAAAPAIVFIDEIDALASRRSSGGGAIGVDGTQTVAQLLTELDGIAGRDGVTVIAATNRPEALDPALLRPGRFDLTVEVGRPDAKGREALLRAAIGDRGCPAPALSRLVARTTGLSGAALIGLVNEARIAATRRGAAGVTPRDYDEASLAIRVGPGRARRPLSDQERIVACLHEAGHAVTACVTPASDPVDRVSVEPLGRTLGRVELVPGEEMRLTRRDAVEGRIVVVLAGRAAEVVFLGEGAITDGAREDLAEAARLAEVLVVRYGADGPFDVDLAASDSAGSEASRARREGSIRRIVAEMGERAMAAVVGNRVAVGIVAGRLEREGAMSGDDVRSVVTGASADGQSVTVDG